MTSVPFSSCRSVERWRRWCQLDTKRWVTAFVQTVKLTDWWEWGRRTLTKDEEGDSIKYCSNIRHCPHDCSKLKRTSTLQNSTDVYFFIIVLNGIMSITSHDICICYLTNILNRNLTFRESTRSSTSSSFLVWLLNQFRWVRDWSASSRSDSEDTEMSWSNKDLQEEKVRGQMRWVRWVVVIAMVGVSRHEIHWKCNSL